MWLSTVASTTVEDMKEEVESYIQVYTQAPIDYTTTQNTILSSTDGLCFLTILAGNQVCVVHLLGRFSSGLGRNTPANNRIFGLLGEKVGEQLPPTVMVPSAGLIPWLTPQNYHQPTIADLAILKDNADTTVGMPEIAGNEDEDADPDRPRVFVQNICFIPKVWAPYYLAPLTPWEAYATYKELIATIPRRFHDSFDYLHAWFALACVHTTRATESVLKAKWQSPHVDRRMIGWMQRHTQYVNAMPMGIVPATNTGAVLDPQECFNKALETVAALRPAQGETKKYSSAELQRLRAACSLTVAEMDTQLLEIHAVLREEGWTTKSVEAVLAHALRPVEEQDDPGLVYISPELVADVKNCKYGLGWDTSYRNCHCGISPFAVPHMSMKHQQERTAYQERLGKALATTVGDVEKVESTPSPAPQDYHGLLQLMSNYIRLLVTLVGAKSAHTREVVAMRRKLRAKIDLYVGIGPWEIIYLLWAIFLDAREFFSRQIGKTDPLPESQLRYTTSFLGIGRIPVDIMGVPLSQFGVGNRSLASTADSTRSGDNDAEGMFRPADWVVPQNASIPDDVSAITLPLLDTFPKATMNDIMSHGSLKYEDIRVGNKGACLNFNLLGVCNNKSCTYQHSKANPTDERVKAVTKKLGPAIQGFISEGGHSTKRRKSGPS
jgi:hypothetical protein